MFRSIILSAMAILTLNIYPCKKLEVMPENNPALNSKDLIKEVPFLMLRISGMTLWKRQSSRIISLHHDKGFPFVQVAPVITSDKDTVTPRFLF